jgi:hypothetical protein
MRSRRAFCLLVATCAGASLSTASAQSLSTLFVSNNGGSVGGVVYFDVNITTPVIVNSLATNTATPGPLGATVYVKSGTYVGSEQNQGAWTLVSTGSGTGAGQDQPSLITLTTPFQLNGGVYGVAIVGAAPGLPSFAHRYTNGTGANQFFSNADLSITLGAAQNAPFTGAPFTPRIWNGTINYTLANPNTTGACCFGNGSCQVVTASACQSGGGIFRGENVTCAAANCPQPGSCCLNTGACELRLESACTAAGGVWGGPGTSCTPGLCPQPGACCLSEGGCQILSEAQCSAIFGTYSGNGTTCAAANCPGGACCLSDGSCVFTTESLCLNTYLGAFNGNGTNCGTQRCATLPVLWNNGPMVTLEAFGCNGGDVSELDTSLQTNTYGFGTARPTLAVADNFTIPAGETWSINEIVLWAYQTGEQTVTINNLGVQIWNGRPGDPGATVVAGDIAVNCLTNAELSNIYRSLSTAVLNCDRRLQQLTCGLSAVLGEGTYWVEATTAGTGASGPWISPVKFRMRPQKPFANGRQRTATGWGDLIDNGAGLFQQDIPFIIRGSLGGTAPCYANCDGSTVQPILNVDDFTCFVNAFAAAQALPPAQQIASYANCDGSTIAPVLNVDDFTCFVNRYAQGCP